LATGNMLPDVNLTLLEGIGVDRVGNMKNWSWQQARRRFGCCMVVCLWLHPVLVKFVYDETCRTHQFLPRLTPFLLYMARLGWSLVFLLHTGTEHTRQLCCLSAYFYLAACSSSQPAAIQYLIPFFRISLRYMLTGMYSTTCYYGETNVCALNWWTNFHLKPVLLGHSQCKTLS
jgi:hypothetical protein